MKLNERVAIITEENISRLSRLYGEIYIDDLSRIVNNHLKVAIDEIEEDSRRQKNAMVIAKIDRKYPYRKEIDFDGEY